MSMPVRLRLDVFRIVALAAVICGAAGVLWIATTSDAIALDGGCVGIDGASYCRMAKGGVGHLPFSRRPLDPALVRLLHYGSVMARFRLVAVVGVLLAVIAVAVLARRTAAALGTRPARQDAAALLAGSLVALLPNGFHEAVFFPVLNDNLAVGLGLAWAACLTAGVRRRQWWWAAAPVGALAVLAREEWALPIVIGSCAVIWLGPERRRAATWSITLAVFALAFDLTRPHVGINYATRSILFHAFTAHFHNGDQVAAFATNYAIALGAIPLLCVPLIWGMFRDRQPTVWVLALIGVTAVVSAPLTGTDVARFVFEGAPALIALATAYAATRPDLDVFTLFVVVASVLAWRPWFVVNSTGWQWATFYAPQLLPGWGTSLVKFLAYLMGIPLALALVAVAATRADRLSARVTYR